MTHRRNRKAFSRCDGADPLLRTYTTLIALELTLKDRAPWPSGHDVAAMLQGAFTPTVDTLATELHRRLALVPCTDRHGNPNTVRPVAYPEMRYFRHDADFADGAPDGVLMDVEEVVQDILKELATAAVTLC